MRYFGQHSGCLEAFGCPAPHPRSDSGQLKGPRCTAGPARITGPACPPPLAAVVRGTCLCWHSEHSQGAEDDHQQWEKQCFILSLFKNKLIIHSSSIKLWTVHLKTC